MKLLHDLILHRNCLSGCRRDLKIHITSAQALAPQIQRASFETVPTGSSFQQETVETVVQYCIMFLSYTKNTGWYCKMIFVPSFSFRGSKSTVSVGMGL